MKKLLLILLFPLSSYCQNYQAGDTIKINKGSLQSGEFRYLFWGESMQKKHRADIRIENKNAIILSSKKLKNTTIPSDLVLTVVDGDTVTILMPYAQNNDEVGGKEYIDEKGFITAFTGTVYKVGDTLSLGVGSMDDGSFKYIRNSSYSFMTAMTATNNTTYNRSASSLDRDYAGRKAKIRKIEEHGTQKMGRKKYAIVKFDIVAQEVDIDAAIRSGEIIDPNYNPNSKYQQQISIADELKKLNDLKEQGILSEEEFQAQKAKLLNK